MTEQSREALAARPLLEKVAAMGDRIGSHTVGEIIAISERAAAWLRDNPPGQPVAIEPRGCPIPGACACVEPEPPADLELRVQRLEAMRETEKAALLDAFRQIDDLKHRIDFQYWKIHQLEEATDTTAPETDD